MNVLIVTGIFPPDSGGPASYVPKMATALCQRGHRVDVVTLSDGLDHDDKAWLFPVHRIRRQLFWLWRLVLTTWTIWRLSRGKDIVYVNGLSSEAALGAWLAQRPAVHKIVGDYAWERAQGRNWFPGTLDEYQLAPKSLRLRLLDAIRTRPLRSARAVVVPSDYLRRIVTGWRIPAEKVRVIYNAIDGGTVADASSSAPPPPGDVLTLVTVCRLVPWKGVAALIRVVATLPYVRLIIAGDGPLRPDLEALAQSTCGERVVFLGHVPHEKVRQLLGEADIFVLNSTYEGLPHVVLEAMAAGAPVIATNAGGTGEVVEHDVTGLLVSVGDELALRAAIERLRSDPALAQRLAVEAKRRLEMRFSFDTMVRETEVALEECAGLRRGLSVLSLGLARGLWEGEETEDYQRMMGYGALLERYVIVANSYKRHGLAPRRFAANIEAIPTNAFTPLDSLLRMFWICWRVLRQGKTSLIQAQDPCFSGPVAVLLGKLFRLPVVVCVYGPNVYDKYWQRSHWSHSFLGIVGRWVLRRASCIQVDGRLTARGLIAAGHSPAQVEVKPLVPVNLSSFFAVHRNGTCPQHVPLAPRLFFAGRLAPQKNLGLLLRAVNRLRKLGCRFELLLAGSGPEEEWLRTRVKSEGLEDCVRFCGNLTREQIVGAFTEADIFVLSSHYEGYPRVLMEAAAAALPIVTTAVSGADEAVVNGESGFIVPIGGLEPLVEKLALLMGDATMRARMGHAGRKHIAEQLDPAMNTPRQLAIWRKVRQ